LQQERAAEQVWRGHNAAMVAGKAEALASAARLAVVRELRRAIQAHVARMRSHGTMTFQEQACLEEKQPTTLHRPSRDNRTLDTPCNIM